MLILSFASSPMIASQRSAGAASDRTAEAHPLATVTRGSELHALASPACLRDARSTASAIQCTSPGQSPGSETTQATQRTHGDGSGPPVKRGAAHAL